jgi:hypothetical protein
VWTAALAVEFEMEGGQPDRLAHTVLRRQAAQFQNDIERGAGIGRTDVKRHSARVDIVSQEAMEQPLQALDVHSPDVRRADGRLNAYLGAEVSNA